MAERVVRKPVLRAHRVGSDEVPAGQEPPAQFLGRVHGKASPSAFAVVVFVGSLQQDATNQRRQDVSVVGSERNRLV